jgi:hypothetical protein
VTNPPVVAVDFDGVIVQDVYPKIGPINQDVVSLLHSLNFRGWYIIIWTCRGGAYLEDAKAFLLENGIPFAAINDHAPWLTAETFGNDPAKYGPCVKIGADIYLDDKGCRYAGSVVEAAILADLVEKKARCIA